jgi:hypothetical protein
MHNCVRKNVKALMGALIAFEMFSPVFVMTYDSEWSYCIIVSSVIFQKLFLQTDDQIT